MTDTPPLNEAAEALAMNLQGKVSGLDQDLIRWTSLPEEERFGRVFEVTLSQAGICFGERSLSHTQLSDDKMRWSPKCENARMAQSL
jgi:hypothetical protein